MEYLLILCNKFLKTRKIFQKYLKILKFNRFFFQFPHEFDFSITSVEALFFRKL